MVARVNVMVSGKVQGVFFRHSALQQAQQLGLAGWVMNLPDGSVELEAEGPEDALADLVAWCKRGPPSAQVEHVRERKIPATGADRTFTIRDG